ncbi:MAG: ATP-dependent DNA helicase [Candidatus Paceibacterota bacterium]
MDLSKLNKEQKQAVETIDGPLLIVAGAGTGKTTVLTNRLAYLVSEQNIKPEEILALTFTEKAAHEMEERAEKLLPFGYYDFWISTFHSFGDRVLKNYGLSIGIPTNYKLLNDSGSWILMRKNFHKFNFLKEYRPLGNPTKFIQALVNHFHQCKNEGIYPSEYLEYADSLKTSLNDIPIRKSPSKTKLKKQATDEEKILFAQSEYERINEIAMAYHTYQKILLDNSCLDFGDLINYTIDLFKKRPEILKKFRDRFKYIMVDEFQDTNWVQYELIKILAAPKNNLAVCADDDQSIFSFQGASFNNVLRFKKDFPESKQVVLTENYRSSQNILDLSYNFIQYNNPNRLEFQLNEISDLQKQAKEKGINLESFEKISKKLKSNKKGPGQICLLGFQTGDEEITGVINKIWELKEIDLEAGFSDFAILVRSNESANSFSRALERANMPYQFISSRGLYTNPLILDVISYLKAILNFYDSSSLYRVLRMLPMDLNAEEVARITQYSDKKGIPVFEAIQDKYLMTKLQTETRIKLGKLVQSLKKHFEISKQKNTSEIFINLLSDLGYDKKLSEPCEENLKNWDLLYQFFQKIKNFEESQSDGKLLAFIEELQMELEAGEEGSLSSSFENDCEAIKVMTVHSAKGLEFKYVFLSNLVHRKFPSDQKSDPIALPEELIKEVLPKGDFHLQEERRLFYVALTRAKDGLFLTWAEDYGGKQRKKPSRFLIEANLISEEVLQNHKIKATNSFCFSKSRNNNFKLESNETSDNKAIKKFLPDHFSFSQLTAFSNCPLQYKFAHILKIPTRGRPNFSYGKTIHNTLHKFIGLAARNIEIKQKDLFGNALAKEKGLNLSLQDLLEIYDKEWIDDWHDGDSKKDYYLKGKEVLKKFYNDLLLKPLNIYFFNEEPALEKTFSLKIDNDLLVGAIDRIDKISENEVELIDYKTGNPKDSLSTDDKFQLLIYQLAAFKIFGLKTGKLSYYYVDDNSIKSFIPTADDLFKTEEKIKELILKIKRSNFKPSPGWNCRFCDYKNICSHKKI